MIIKSEERQDVPTIREIVRLAFSDAPHSRGTEAAIIDGLRAAGALSNSLVAIDAGRIVGHIATSPVEIEKGSGRWFGLGPVSVIPDRQLQGIGSAIITEALKRLRKSGAAGCVVLGDPAYYRRFGFEHDPAVRYRDVPPPYFQLLSFTGQRPSGAIEYHRAFETVS